MYEFAKTDGEVVQDVRILVESFEEVTGADISVISFGILCVIV